MAGDTITTIVGNLVADPELRFTPSGAAVSNFTIASTPRQFDKDSNSWKDGETLFMRCSVWRNAAENVAESLTKGTRVIASGRLKSRSYEKDGQKHTVVEMEVDEVGPSLTFATARVQRAERTQGQGGQPNAATQAAFGGQAQQQFQQGGQNPWATGPSQGQGQPQGQPGQQNPGGWGGGPQQGGQAPQQGGWGGAPPAYDEPPF